MKTSPIAIAAALGATTQAFASDTGKDDVWSWLSQIEIDEVITDTSYEVKKSFPAVLQHGEVSVEITGYVQPALPGETIRDLIMVADMGLCPFCGSGEHGGSLVVSLAEPIETFDETRRVTLRGALVPVHDPETWQAAILKDATLIE